MHTRLFGRFLSSIRAGLHIDWDDLVLLSLFIGNLQGFSRNFGDAVKDFNIYRRVAYRI